MIGDSNEYGTPSKTEVQDFEETNNIKLPMDYKDFLFRVNGGRPIPNRNASPSTVVVYLLGMHNGPYHKSLYKHIEMLNKRLPFGTFPVGRDPFGNLFIMTVNPETYGYIYFWDHEGEPEYQDGNYVDNCYFVAYSFSDFVNNLK